MAAKETPILARHFAAEFRCAGPACPDTCCGGWNITVDRTSEKKYLRQPDLKDSMQATEKGPAMRLDPQSRICVQHVDGLCGIQLRHGESYLSDTCHFYPRSYRRFGSQLQMSANLSCPEAARAALFDSEPFHWSGVIRPSRLPDTRQDFLPHGMTQDTQHAITESLLQWVLRPETAAETTPEKRMAKLLDVAFALEGKETAEWMETVRGKLASPLPPAHHAPAPLSDVIALFRGSLGLAIEGAQQYRPRLYATLRDIEHALQLTAHWTEGSIATGAGSARAWSEMQTSWAIHGKAMEDVLRRWLGAQICLHAFPFSGLSESNSTCGVLLGVHFALLRLALMAACHIRGSAIDTNEQLRIVQSIARQIDHVQEDEQLRKHFPIHLWHRAERIYPLIGDR